jgi:hypothetical protein
MTTGHELIKILQDLGDEALKLPVKVPYHQQYDSNAELADANLVTVHGPWADSPTYLSITHGADGSESWEL